LEEEADDQDDDQSVSVSSSNDSDEDSDVSAAAADAAAAEQGLMCMDKLERWPEDDDRLDIDGHVLPCILKDIDPFCMSLQGKYCDQED
jgi:hypothetical protein